MITSTTKKINSLAEIFRLAQISGGVVAGLAMVVPALADPASDKAAALKALTDVLPGPLVNDPTSLEWAVYGDGQTHKIVKATSIPGGGAAMQVTVTKPGPDYAVSANVPLTVAITRGQQLVIGFYARTIAAETTDGRGTINVRFQQNADPFPGFGDSRQSIGKVWTFYQVPATASIDLAKGVGIAVFHLAGAKQTLEIGQAIVITGASQILRTTETVALAAPPIMPPQLQGKGILLNDPANRAWNSYGLSSPALPIKAGIPGGAATRYSTISTGANVWDAGAAVLIDDAIAVGDMIQLSFIARTISATTDDGKGRLSVSIQQRAAPYNGLGAHAIAPGPNWGLVQIRTQATMALPKGSAQVMFHMAGAKQVVEIGPVYVQKAPMTAQ